MVKNQWYDNKLTRVFNLWYKCVIEGYALDFVVECHWSLTKALKFVKKGLRGRLIEELLVWIKILIVEGSMLPSPTKMGL